ERETSFPLLYLNVQGSGIVLPAEFHKFMRLHKRRLSRAAMRAPVSTTKVDSGGLASDVVMLADITGKLESLTHEDLRTLRTLRTLQTLYEISSGINSPSLIVGRSIRPLCWNNVCLWSRPIK